MFGHVHVCRTLDAERVQVLCKWCALCASGLLHCATACCTLSSQISFCSGCAWGPWIHNSNNSNNCYNSYKQVGAGVVVERQVERQVDPYKQVGAGVKGAGVRRRLVVV